MLAGLWPQRPWEHEQWPACQRVFAHALTTTDQTQRLGSAPEQTARLLARVGQYQEARAQYTPARELLARAVAIFEAVYGPEHPEVAGTLDYLGIVQQQLGELEAARATVERALAIFEQRLGPQHPYTAQAREILSEMESTGDS